MTLGDDLILCSGTLAPTTPLADVAAAAAEAGFTGVSLWGREHGHARATGLSDADIRAVLRDHGLTVEYLDPAWWWAPGAADSSIPPEADEMELFSYGERAMFGVAEAVGAEAILAIDAFGGNWTVDEGAEAFGAFCDRAARAGLAVHLEPLPWSHIPDLATAWEIVRRADRPNGGLAVDAWHFHRGRPDLDLLRTIPADRFTAVILDDAPATAEDDLLDEAMHRRLAPGEGGLDLTGLLQALRDIGVDVPVGVEVLSDRFHERPPAEAARLAATATRAALDEAAIR